MFKYEPELVPEVKLEGEWALQDGSSNQTYRVNGWSMELPEDGNLGDVKRAIYAWIAWYDFLSTAQKGVKDV